MNPWKLAFFSLLAAALGTLVWMGLKLADQSAWFGLLSDHYERQEIALTTLRRIAPEIAALQHPATRDEITAMLLRENPGRKITTGTSTIEIDELRFQFDANGGLARIERTDDYGTTRTDTPRDRDAISASPP